MSSSEDSVLTLSDIRSCMKNYRSCLVYQENSRFCNATSQPTWIKAFLSRAIICCIAQYSGNLENSEVSNFIRKNIGATSHNIDEKIQYLYEELIKDDCQSIEEEEKHLCIALSRCAYLYFLDDYKKKKSTTMELKIFKKLSEITFLTPEGKKLSDKIKSSLIASIGLKIGRQCLPCKYTFDKEKESNLSEVLASIDSVKLLTAAIITALNYQNDNMERRTTDDKVDQLTKHIHSYLLSDIGKKSKIEELTIEKIYKAVAPKSVIVICRSEKYDSETGKPIKSFLVNDLLAEEALEFMGLDAELLNLDLIDAKKLFTINLCESAGALKDLLRKCYPMIETIWTRIAKNIRNNYLHTLRASSYYDDAGEVTHELDEVDYPIPAYKKRLRIILNRTYPDITGIIQQCGCDEDFFTNCSLEISTDKPDRIIEMVIDSIVALILISFCYCKTLYDDKELYILKKNYIEKLRTCIQNKFAHIPSGNGGNNMVNWEEIFVFLKGLRNQLIEDGQFERAEDIDKYLEQKNIGFHDENSKLPPSRGRD